MKAIASWMWVMMGVVLGLVIFASSYIILMRVTSARIKQLAWSEYDYLFSKIKTTCSIAGIGGLYHHKISVPEAVRAIYVANYSDEYPPAKVSVYISEKASATGEYFCMQYFDNEFPECRKLDCKLTMTYMGTPSLKSDLASLVARLAGGATVYKFDIDMNKTYYKDVRIEATQIVE
jgi:hypothetical protein